VHQAERGGDGVDGELVRSLQAAFWFANIPRCHSACSRGRVSSRKRHHVLCRLLVVGVGGLVSTLQGQLGQLAIDADDGVIEPPRLSGHGANTDIADLGDAHEHPSADRQRQQGYAEPHPAAGHDEPVFAGVARVANGRLLAEGAVSVLAGRSTPPGFRPLDVPADRAAVMTSSMSQVRARPPRPSSP
jgi:hypothetical protein